MAEPVGQPGVAPLPAPAAAPPEPPVASPPDAGDPPLAAPPPEPLVHRALRLLRDDPARLVRALLRRVAPAPKPIGWAAWKRRHARWDRRALDRLAAETAVLPITFTVLTFADAALAPQAFGRVETIPLDAAPADWTGLAGMGSGSHLCLLPAGTRLPPEALALAARFLATTPADLLYADSELLDPRGRALAPELRAGFDPDLFYGADTLGPLRIIRREALRAIPRPVAGPSDLVLALIEQGRAIRHLPAVLSSAAPAPAPVLPADVLAAHLARILPAPPRVTDGPLPGSHALVWPLPAKPPRLSVIVPTRDHADDLARCLAGLERSNWPDAEILVIDNRSTEPSARALLGQLAGRPGFQVLSYEKAFNYSAINNWAALHATGDLLLLLNNDATLVEPESLRRMAGQALRPGIGAVGARLLYPDGRLQHAGTVLGQGGVAGHLLPGSPGDAAGPQNRLRLTHRASAVTAAALMLRRDLWQAVGGMDDVNLPVAFNDVDLCLKLDERGHGAIVECGAVFTHAESISRGEDRTPAEQARFAAEIAHMKRRWGHRLTADPWHNPALSLDHTDGRLKTR